MSTTYTYIEVVEFDKGVAHRIDVTGKSDRAVDRVEEGMQHNLNHERFFTRVQCYETEQPMNP